MYNRLRTREQLLPRRGEGVGRGGGWGAPQQIRCQRSKPIANSRSHSCTEYVEAPSTPDLESELRSPRTPPSAFAQRLRRMEGGGARTAHDFAISPQVFSRGIHFFPPSSNRARRECRALDAPDSRACDGSG